MEIFRLIPPVEEIWNIYCFYLSYKKMIPIDWIERNGKILVI